MIEAYINQFVAAIYSTNVPITVVVTDEQWAAFGIDTPRGQFLGTMLQALGGVNESTPPGTYHFNMVAHWFKMSFTFEPAELESPK